MSDSGDIAVLQTQLAHITDQLDEIKEMVTNTHRDLEGRVRALEQGQARVNVAVAVAGTLGTAAAGLAVKVLLGGGG